jgi:hypothetical protein
MARSTFPPKPSIVKTVSRVSFQRANPVLRGDYGYHLPDTWVLAMRPNTMPQMGRETGL